MITAVTAIVPKLTVKILLSIQLFCGGFFIEDPSCENEVIGCFLDDIYTVSQCKTEYLTDMYGESNERR